MWQQAFISVFIILMTSVRVFAQESPTTPIDLPYGEIVAIYGPWMALLILASPFIYRYFTQTTEHRHRLEIIDGESDGQAKTASAKQTEMVSLAMAQALTHAQESSQWNQELAKNVIDKTNELAEVKLANIALEKEKEMLDIKIEQQANELSKCIETMREALRKNKEEHQLKILAHNEKMKTIAVELGVDQKRLTVN